MNEDIVKAIAEYRAYQADDDWVDSGPAFEFADRACGWLERMMAQLEDGHQAKGGAK